MFPTQFTGASFTWERKKLGILITRVKSYPLSRSVEVKKETDVKYVHYGDIHTNIADEIDKNNNLPFINEIYKEYDELKLDDVIVADASEDYKGIADAAVIISNLPYTIIAGLHTIALRPTSLIKGYFLYHIFKTENFKRFGYKIGTGLKVFGISYNNLAKYKVYYPQKIEEQEKIIGILSNLTNSINLHEDHLQFLHSFKSFLLQKMFFDNDIPPLLRFNKFTEKWNQCRLNDHTIVTMGQSPNSKNYTNNQTGKILVQGNADLYKNKVLKRVFTTEVTKTAVKNDILISVRAPVGDIARNQYESVVIGRGIASIKGNDFLYYQFEKMKNNGFWNKYIAGSTFESITGKDLKNTKIYTTNSDEERKIGNIFSSLTKIIQLQEHKIDSLKKLKQFLLQNMFI
ncbi:restriction endonuclease subunit S [Ligilactobacillus salivarius]|uniref:restriction endonuclease subunit S n=1 Tax=Ligilactobacillus salivarius TaxID=1624 RepID=UPI002102104F|nr:restriction endonuclease subunit S [Ligilactobacillus salivarius]UTX35953.1 restriction endonuclease subunit S [Ligilactobacillus salivarius]